MTISTYSNLQDAIFAWLLRASTDLVVTTERVKEYIALCEVELNRELRVRELEQSVAVATVADQAYAALPSDFKKISDFYYDSSPYEINFIPTKGALKRKHGTAIGRPKDYTIWGSRIYFGAVPDAIYALTLDYYEAITPLSDSATTNEIFPAYSDLYLYGALVQACFHTKNKAFKDEVNEKYVGIVERIKDANLNSKMAANVRMVVPNRLA